MRSIAGAALLAIVLAGCTAARNLTLPEHRPADLMLAATVYTPERMVAGAGGADRLPRSLRPARYVIEADSSLRAVRGSGVDAATFPPRVTQLSTDQMETLWRQFKESGLLDPGSPSRIEAPEEAVRSASRPTAMVYASFLGRRTTLRVVLDRAGRDALEAERLVDRLAGWAGEK